MRRSLTALRARPERWRSCRRRSSRSARLRHDVRESASVNYRVRGLGSGREAGRRGSAQRTKQHNTYMMFDPCSAQRRTRPGDLAPSRLRSDGWQRPHTLGHSRSRRSAVGRNIPRNRVGGLTHHAAQPLLRPVRPGHRDAHVALLPPARGPGVPEDPIPGGVCWHTASVSNAAQREGQSFASDAVHPEPPRRGRCRSRPARRRARS